MKKYNNFNLFNNYYSLFGDRGEILSHNIRDGVKIWSNQWSIIRFYSTNKVNEDEVLIPMVKEDSIIKDMVKEEDLQNGEEVGEEIEVEERDKIDESLKNKKRKSESRKLNNDELNKEIERVKRLKEKILGGFYGYNIVENLGTVEEVVEDSNENENENENKQNKQNKQTKHIKDKKQRKKKSKVERVIRKFFSKLEGDMSYSLLTVIRYLNYDTGETSGYTVGESIKINKYVNVEEVSKLIQDQVKSKQNKYTVIEDDADVMLIAKEWLPDSEFKVKKKELTELYNELIVERKPESKKDR